MLQQINPELTVIDNYRHLRAANEEHPFLILYQQLTEHEKRMMDIVFTQAAIGLLRERCAFSFKG